MDAMYKAFRYYRACIKHLSVPNSFYNKQEEPKGKWETSYSLIRDCLKFFSDKRQIPKTFVPLLSPAK